MRRVGVIVALLIFLPLILGACTKSKGTSENGPVEGFLDSTDELRMETSAGAGPEAGGDVSIALERIVRTVMNEGGEEGVEVYDFEYADSELRTSVVHKDSQGRAHRADAFFNIDGTLSFVRMRDAGGNTKTVHFVYDSNGNPVERILSQDDVPLEKIEYSYDSAKQYRRELKLYEWVDGRWRRSNGRTLVLYVNAAGFPTAFEVSSPGGRRNIVFEYAQGADAIDDYVDTAFSVDGGESSVSGFVSYKDGRPDLMTIRSDGNAEEETRIIASWKESAGGERQIGETVERCGADGCDEVERRTFTYEARDSKPLMPPASIVAPLLELGSSLLFIEKPAVLLGPEGIGLPSWIL